MSNSKKTNDKNNIQEKSNKYNSVKNSIDNVKVDLKIKFKFITDREGHYDIDGVSFEDGSVIVASSLQNW